MDINTVDTIITCPKSVPKAGTAGLISRKLVGQWDSDPLTSLQALTARKGRPKMSQPGTLYGGTNIAGKSFRKKAYVPFGYP